MLSRSVHHSFILILVMAPAAAHAHGESARGVGGVGTNTTGGEVETDVSISTRVDVRSYKLFSDLALLDYQLQGEDVHQHARETSLFLAGTFGFARHWDLTIMMQANRFDDFADNSDAQALATGGLSRTDVSQGIGDLLVLGRRQVVARGRHRLAVIGGIKLPTGSVRETTNGGDIVGTHNQPGSGSVDFQGGLGYSTRLGDHLRLSADALFRINTEGSGEFRSGNSIQTDVAAGLPIGRTLVASLELNGLYQERDMERDEIKQNSGVTSLFATPALRVNVGRHGGFVALSVPIYQDFPGISNDERARVGAGYSYTFGGDDHVQGARSHSHVAGSQAPATPVASR